MIQKQLLIAEKQNENVLLPLEVAEMITLKEYSPIKAWRIYLGKTQKEIANILKISQSAFSQIETSATNHAETLEDISKALGIPPEKLTI